MSRKGSTEVRTILLLLFGILICQSTTAEFYRKGCLLDNEICDKNEYCHNDNLDGICLLDAQLGFNEQDSLKASENILNNLNENIGDNELNEDSNDKYDNLRLENIEIGRENEPKILLSSDENVDTRPSLLSIIGAWRERDALLSHPTTDQSKQVANEVRIAPDDLIGDFVVSNDGGLARRTDNLRDKLKEIDETLDEADELVENNFGNDDLDQNIDKKLDQKKPGPRFNPPDVDEQTFDGMSLVDSNTKFNNKRFNEARILSSSALNDENALDILKRKFSFSPTSDSISVTQAPDRKPVEEGAVHVELDPQKTIAYVEAASDSDQNNSPFVAVDSSYAYIYFTKIPLGSLGKRSSQNHSQILSDDQLMAQDDILARKFFVNNLEKEMSLPRGSFSDIKLDSADFKTLSNCITFPLLKYLVSYDNDEQNCNCKLLIASFKVNPNIQQLNASSVADRVEQYKVNLQTRTGLYVIETGIGDKVKIERKRNCRLNLLLTFINLSLCAIAAILVTLLVILYHRRDCLQQKIYNAACIGAPTSFAGWFGGKDYTTANLASKPQKLSKADLEKQALDYQDLCRQRMKSNQQNKKFAGKDQCNDEMKAVYQTNGNVMSNVEKSRTQQKSQPNTSTTPSNDQLMSAAMNMDISTGHLILEYMENHLKQNGDKLNREWNALCALANDESYLQATQNAAQLNPHKNRFPNDPTKWPFDHSRVILNDLETKDQIDYINASTIIDSDPNPIYIATQGPMKETISDFYQLIWDQGASVIVMLTRLVENGVEQSTKYWPEKGSESHLHFEVNLVSEHIWSEQYLVRSLYLKNKLKNETRTVTQFHFMSWPVNCVPSSSAPLLEFRRKVNKSYREKSSPIIVHCSDGCNRTGAYILIDIVLNRLTKGVKEIDLAATLEALRDQRPGMVNNKETFEFCLRSIAEEVHNLLRSLQK